MNTRKILSLGLASLMIMNPALVGISHAATNYSENSFDETDSYASTVKMKKFLRWESKILAYMTKDFKTVVKKMNNPAAQKAYAAEFIDVLDWVKNVFANGKYDSDYMLDSHVTNLKKEIAAYKDLRKEILTLAGTNANPFSLNPDEILGVENDTIDIQKTVTQVLRKALDTYSTSDTKETGKMNFSAEGSFGKVDVSVEKYTKLLSILTASQEASVTAKANFSLNIPGSYEYDEKTDEYVRSAAKTISWSLSIDGSIKMINQDIYLTLSDYSLQTNMTGKDSENLTSGLEKLAKYKGKTLKISIPNDTVNTRKINQAEILAQFRKVLDLLETKSLLSPTKKIGDIYTMNINSETIKSLGIIYGQKMTIKDITQTKKAIRKISPFYSNAGGKKILFINIHERDAVGKMSLEKKADGYSFLADITNPLQSGEVFHILLETGFAEAKLASEALNLDMLYKNKNLMLNAKWMDQTIQIQWSLSEESTNLDVTFNENKIGNITWKKVGDTYTYDMLFKTPIIKVLTQFHIRGESTITKGTFPIIAPKDFIEEDMESLFE